MIKRIFTNLFSNILKYGDKGTAVKIRSSIRRQRFTLTVSNAIKQEHTDVGSSNIGLRNVQRMMQLMEGEMLLAKKENSFQVILWFPLR